LKLNIEKNIGYLKTDVKKRKVYKTIEVNDDKLVDVNSDGEIVGIELLNPDPSLLRSSVVTQIENEKPL
jgi:uncharacterized protein YuzE